MKLRHNDTFRVLYDLSGRRQEEITQYQGFLEVADQAGWQVITVSDQIESQIRHLSESEKVDAVVGDFVSAAWLATLPERVIKLHMGSHSLGPVSSGVVWDMKEIGSRLRQYLVDQGYTSCWVFGPQDQPLLREGLQAEGQFRTSEMLREGLSDLRNVAVVSPTDYGARNAYRVIRRSGRSVPDDLGVAGIGGRTLDAVLSDVSLTTVLLPYAEKGRRLGAVLKRLRDGAPAQNVSLPPVRILPGDSTQKGQPTRSLQQDAVRELTANLQNPPQVEEWARRNGMSRRGYERSFSAEAGCTPYEFLLRLREQEAKRLLRETSLPLYRIGEAVGIPDPPRFSAFFKKRAGVPASEWRKAGVGL